MTSARIMLGALLATTALLSGCSTGAGPLSEPAGYSGGECLPDQPGKFVSAGWTLTNHGSSVATIHNVHLPGAHDIRTTKAWLVPNFIDPKTGANAVGVAWGFPWPVTVKIIPSWNKRQPAIGAVIRPGEMTSIDFGVTRTSAKTARSGGPVIVYTADGNAYTQQENVSLELAHECNI